MPVAQERVLEKIADKKGLKGKDRDRFIYGTMVNQGWRPNVDKSRKNMTSIDSRIIRLQKINNKLDICFASYYDDEERRRSILGGAAKLGAVAAAGAGATYGGYKLHGAIRNRQAGLNIGVGPRTGYLAAASDLASDRLQSAANFTRQGAGAVGDAAKTAGAATLSGLKTAGSASKDYLDAASIMASNRLQGAANVARQGAGAVGSAAMSGARTAGSTVAKHGSGALEAIMKKIRAFRGK